MYRSRHNLRKFAHKIKSEGDQVDSWYVDADKQRGPASPESASFLFSLMESRAGGAVG